MAFNWNFDMGGAGFGRADYAEALRRGGTSRKELETTRQAVKKWIENPGTNQTIGSNIKQWVTGGTDLGSTMYGRKGQDEAETKIYGKADLWADLAQGRTYSDILSHFSDTPANLAKLSPAGDAFKVLSSEAKKEREAEIRNPLEKKIKEGETKTKTAEAATKAAQDKLTKALATSASLESTVADLGNQLSGQQAGYASLKKEYQSELNAIRDKEAMTRTSAPRSVSSPSPLSIRFAQGPKRTGFRGTLAGLTRPVAASNKLRSTSLNV